TEADIPSSSYPNSSFLSAHTKESEDILDSQGNPSHTQEQPVLQHSSLAYI
ncbi:unnamed protein product, partial [Candidula unifasciata]